MRLALARIFQESLTNALKHGHARSIEARLRCDGAGGIELQVRDDGCGFDPSVATPGRGVSGMRARAVELGGRLSIESAPGGGGLVAVTLPLEPRRQESQRDPHGLSGHREADFVPAQGANEGAYLEGT